MKADTASTVEGPHESGGGGGRAEALTAWLLDATLLAGAEPSDTTLRTVLADSVALFRHGPRIEGVALPSWYNEYEAIGYQRLSTDSLWLLDALARFEGASIMARDPLRLRWGEHRLRTADGHRVSHPAVLGYRWPYCTVEDIAQFAVRAADGNPEEPQHVIAAINCFINMCQLRGWVADDGTAPPSS